MLEAGYSSCLWPQRTSRIGAPLDFLRVSAQAATPLLPQTSRFGYPCSAAAPFPQGRCQLREAEKSQACLLKNHMGSWDHIMRHTPVCPARQWALPPAFTGTMTSDLKFCFLLAFLKRVGSEQ